MEDVLQQSIPKLWQSHLHASQFQLPFCCRSVSSHPFTSHYYRISVFFLSSSCCSSCQLDFIVAKSEQSLFNKPDTRGKSSNRICDILGKSYSSAVKWWKKAYLEAADSLLGDFTIKKWNDKSSRLHQLSRNTVARRCEDTTGNIQEDMTSCEWPFLQLHEYKGLTDVAQLCNIWVFAPQKSKTTFSSFHGLCGQNKTSSLQTWIQMEVISILLRIDICFQGGSSARNHAEL